MKIAGTLTGTIRLGAPLLVAAVLSLTGCTAAEVTNPGGALTTDDLAQGTAVQVTADAKKIATTLDETLAVDGTYPPALPQVNLTGTNTVVNYLRTAVGVSFCVVEPKTGAWAFYDSAQGGVAGSGDTGQACTAGSGTGAPGSVGGVTIPQG